MDYLHKLKNKVAIVVYFFIVNKAHEMTKTNNALAASQYFKTQIKMSDPCRLLKHSLIFPL